MTGMQALHKADPVAFDKRALAARFKIPYDAVSRILRSKFLQKVNTGEVAWRESKAVSGASDRAKVSGTLERGGPEKRDTTSREDKRAAPQRRDATKPFPPRWSSESQTYTPKRTLRPRKPGQEPHGAPKARHSFGLMSSNHDNAS